MSWYRNRRRGKRRELCEPAPMVTCLLPGMAEDERMWTDVQALAPQAEVVDPRRGVDAGAPDLVSRYADVVLAGLPAEPAVLVGHSLGGVLALEVARRTPVRGLVLVGCGLPMAVSPKLVALVQEDPDAALALIASAATGGRRGAVGAGKEAIAQRLREQMAGTDPARNAAELQALGAWDPSAWLAALEVPAIVLAGSEDKMVPPEAAGALAATLQADLKLLAGVGHQLPWEAPDVVADAIAALT